MPSCHLKYVYAFMRHIKMWASSERLRDFTSSLVVDIFFAPVLSIKKFEASAPWAPHGSLFTLLTHVLCLNRHATALLASFVHAFLGWFLLRGELGSRLGGTPYKIFYENTSPGNRSHAVRSKVNQNKWQQSHVVNDVNKLICRVL